MVTKLSNENHDLGKLAKNRGKIIIRTSIVGIITNFALAGIKVSIGLITNSIAVILDAINNLSDSLSSVVTIIGEKLASRKPDKKHPMGHGRIEYISAMAVSALVLCAGITSLLESIKKIINPSVANYSVTSIVIIGITVVAKLILGKYVQREGKKVKSMALIASGSDALFDAIISLSVLISAVIFMLRNVSLEAYVGIVISAFMIRSGLKMMGETINSIIGQRADKETIDKVKSILQAEDAVNGVYDLALFNYGPNKFYCTAHLELPDTMTVDEVDRLTRKLQYEVYEKLEIILLSVGVYSLNTKNDKAAEIRKNVQELVLAHKWALQFHGFYAYTEENVMRFDVVLSFDVDINTALDMIKREIKEIYPEYEVQITPDVDYSN